MEHSDHIKSLKLRFADYVSPDALAKIISEVMEGLRSQHSLTAFGIESRYQNLVAIYQELLNHHEITDLSFSGGFGPIWGPENVTAVNHLIANKPALRSLKIDSNGIDISDALMTRHINTNVFQLEELKLKHGVPRDLLAQYLGSTTTLKHFAWIQPENGPINTVENIIAAAFDNPNIVSIALVKFRVEIREYNWSQNVAKFLATNTTLEKLELHEQSTDYRDFRNILLALGTDPAVDDTITPHPTLKSLRLVSGTFRRNPEAEAPQEEILSRETLEQLMLLPNLEYFDANPGYIEPQTVNMVIDFLRHQVMQTDINISRDFSWDRSLLEIVDLKDYLVAINRLLKPLLNYDYRQVKWTEISNPRLRHDIFKFQISVNISQMSPEVYGEMMIEYLLQLKQV